MDRLQEAQASKKGGDQIKERQREKGVPAWYPDNAHTVPAACLMLTRLTPHTATIGDSRL